MDQENITFFENDDKSYTVVDLYINSNRYLKHTDSYNYYDINLTNIIIYRNIFFIMIYVFVINKICSNSNIDCKKY